MKVTANRESGERREGKMEVRMRRCERAAGRRAPNALRIVSKAGRRGRGGGGEGGGDWNEEDGTG